ncbi:MAG: hypothetical protein IH621_11145, partial [Krumholzibacteria bacterium]|nr:hypothetical protein [Candidatus Krumholzibacteria bacterium]
MRKGRASRRSARTRPTHAPAAALGALAALLVGLGVALPAVADPVYPGPLLYGLDPVVRST